MKINESPDTAKRQPPLRDTIPLKFGVPFGYYKNKFYAGGIGDTHEEMWREMAEDEDLVSDEAWEESRNGADARRMFTYAGRVYSKFMLLTLWEFPNEKDLKKLEADIAKNTKRSFFKIEIQPLGKIDDMEIWYTNHAKDPQQINIKDYKVKGKLIQPVINESLVPSYSEFINETR